MQELSSLTLGSGSLSFSLSKGNGIFLMSSLESVSTGLTSAWGAAGVVGGAGVVGVGGACRLGVAGAVAVVGVGGGLAVEVLALKLVLLLFSCWDRL